jgi:hypothetical protein
MADALRAFEAELESKNFKGYWQNVQGDVYREPVPCSSLAIGREKIFLPPWKKPAMWSAWTYPSGG